MFYPRLGNYYSCASYISVFFAVVLAVNDEETGGAQGRGAGLTAEAVGMVVLFVDDRRLPFDGQAADRTIAWGCNVRIGTQARALRKW